MKDISAEQLKKYLEHVIELEGQILVGQKAIDAIEKKKSEALKLNKAPSNITIEKPQKKEIEAFYDEKINGAKFRPCPHPESSIPTNTKTIVRNAIIMFVAFFSIPFFFLTLFDVNVMPGCIASITISLLLTGVILSSTIKMAKEIKQWRLEKEEFEQNSLKEKEKILKEKEKRLKDIENEYKLEMALYSSRVKEAEEEYNEAITKNNQLTKSIEDAATIEVKKIDDAIWSTKTALQKVYDKNIIHPKYQNFIAVCSLYEYLSTGRCNCLEGHEGAYNLYEAELRQDLILIKLDTIISQLDDIKKNQYALYQKMCEIQSTVSSISHQMGELLKKADTLVENTDRIANNTAMIAENTRVTALCSQMIAKNTEAIKYISLIN